MYDLIVKLLGYLRGIWRFRWWILGVAWVISIVGWLVVAKMPDQYQATARVYVDTQSMLKPLLRGLAIAGSERQRLLLMSKTLLSRPNLEKVMRMADLDLQAKTPEQKEAILQKLKNNIHLQSTRDINLYTISYEDSNPELAKLIVKSLLTIFVESSLGESRKDQDQASQFLKQQIAEYEQRLEEAEARRARFKQKNMAFLAGNGSNYYDKLQQNEAALAQAELDLKIQQDRLQALKAQMEAAADEETSYDELIPTEAAVTTPYDARIAALEAKLDDLLLRYTEKHPDVQGTKRTLEDLKAKRDAELAVAMEQGGDAGGGGETQPTNPIYQQLRLTYADAKANVAAKRAIVEEYKKRIKNLKKAVDQVLQVEAEEKRLNRDYNVIKKQHQTLLGRLESARMTKEMDSNASAVRFRVIDPPRVPAKPSGPPRVLLSSVVLLGGLGAGILLAFFLSQLRPTFDDRRTLNETTDLPVLGSVSMLWTREQITKRRWRHYAFLLSLLLLVAAYGAVTAVFMFDIDWGAYLGRIRQIAGI